MFSSFLFYPEDWCSVDLADTFIFVMGCSFLEHIEKKLIWTIEFENDDDHK